MFKSSSATIFAIVVASGWFASSWLLPVTCPAQAAAVLGDTLVAGDYLTLSQAMNQGLRDSPRVAAARAQLGIAKSALVQAATLPNPAFFLDNQYQFTYKTGASIPIEPPWRLVLRVIAAKRQITQADLEIARSLWLFRGEVRRTYAELVVAQEMANIRKQLVALADKLSSVAKDRFEAGDVPRLDVHRAELALVQADIQSEQTDITVAQNREQLNILIGRAAEAALFVPLLSPAADNLLPDLQQPLPSREELTARAHQNRLELKILKQSRSVNQANLKNAFGSILPAPRVTVGSMTEDKINGPLNRNTWFLQVQADVPIFNFQQGDISKFRATIKQLDMEFLSQQNIIDAQVSLAYKKVSAARARIKKYQERALQISGRITAAAELGYRMGQSDITSALTVQQDNIQVQSQYLDSVLAYQLAMNELEQSVGIPLQ